MMSAVRNTAASSPTEDIDGLDAIMRRGGEQLRERMLRTELHLERVTAQSCTRDSHWRHDWHHTTRIWRPLLRPLAP